MSSDTDDAAATVVLFDSFYTENYCDMAVAVLFVYDTIITFDQEVAYFWTAKRIGGASLLFFANKWISLTVYVMLLVSFASFPSDKSCALFAIAGQAISILQFLPGAAFSTLRAYVLSRSKSLGLLVAVLSLAPVGANLVIYGYQYSGVNFPPLGCLNTDNSTVTLDLKSHAHPRRNRAVVIISRVPLIAADIILIYITWKKLRGLVTLTDVRQSKRLTLADILFRGGIIYFVILFVLNVLHLVFSATSVASDNGAVSLLTEFTTPITALLISRFLLELQEANQAVVKLDANDPLHFGRNTWNGTPSFIDISSLGGYINPTLPARSDDDDGIELQVRSPSEAPEEEGGVWTEVPVSSPSTA